MFFIYCCPVLRYSLEAVQNRQLNAIKKLEVAQHETAEWEEQYTLYQKKKAEKFISVFIALQLELGSSQGPLLKCHLAHIYATC